MNTPSCIYCDRPSVLEFRGQPLCEQCLGIVSVKCIICNTNIGTDDAIMACGGCFCENCFNQFYVNCQSCGRVIERGGRQVNGYHYCADCFNVRYRICNTCGIAIGVYDAMHDPNDNIICTDCYDTSCAHCNNCGLSFWSHDIVRRNGTNYCSECLPENDEWESGEFHNPHPCFAEIKSHRKYGIELETSNCDGYRDLKDNTIWECKRDCSIEGREFVSPILFGDEGLTLIKEFCVMADRRDWDTDRYCGYHVHLDVSNESWDRLRSIAYAYRLTYPMWCHLVPDRRASNPYCGPPNYTCNDVIGISSESDWDYFVGARDRFEFVNWRAYLVHGSVEIRSHAGSLDEDEICNWIKLHARFIDAVSNMSRVDIRMMFGGCVAQCFTRLVPIVGVPLAEYYAARAHRFGTPVVIKSIPVLEAPF